MHIAALLVEGTLSRVGINISVSILTENEWLAFLWVYAVVYWYGKPDLIQINFC